MPVLNEQGPDALDPTLDASIFPKRLARYRGQIKNALVNARLIAGIGNAHSDEILFNAGIHPFTKISSLPPERRARLFDAMRETLNWASGIAAAQIGERIDRKPREVLTSTTKTANHVSRPRCDNPISEVSPNRRHLVLPDLSARIILRSGLGNGWTVSNRSS